MSMTKKKAAEILELSPGYNFDQVRTAFQDRFNILTNLRVSAAFEPTDERRYSEELILVKEAARALGYEPEMVRPVETRPQIDGRGMSVPSTEQNRELLDLGKKEFEQRKFAEAICSFEVALKLDPKNGEARLGLEKAKAAHVGNVKLTAPVMLAFAVGSSLAGWFMQELAATGSFYFFPKRWYFPYSVFGALLAITAGFLVRKLSRVSHQRTGFVSICGWFLGWSASVGFGVTDVLLGILPAILFTGMIWSRARRPIEVKH